MSRRLDRGRITNPDLVTADVTDRKQIPIFCVTRVRASDGDKTFCSYDQLDPKSEKMVNQLCMQSGMNLSAHGNDRYGLYILGRDQWFCGQSMTARNTDEKRLLIDGADEEVGVRDWKEANPSVDSALDNLLDDLACPAALMSDVCVIHIQLVYEAN